MTEKMIVIPTDSVNEEVELIIDSVVTADDENSEGINQDKAATKSKA